MQLEPGALVDRYTVAGLLGEGGMSVVYKVRHNTLGSLHALKVLTLTSPGLRDRLLTEGKLQANIRHPNIVPVTDVVDVNGAPGLVMEYVEGPDLHTLLRAHPLTFDQVDALAKDIIGAVAAAHAKGMIHRDLKPANIMLMIVGDRLVPKIMDFGLAKSLHTSVSGKPGATRTGAMMGTPYYMAPEQVRDSKNVGAQADVFSLGAILYEMVTRRRAFEGDDVYEVFGAVAEGRFVPVREVVADVPTRMETAIGAALRVDPAARCRDCRELLALWNGEVTADGVAVGPSSPWSGEILRDAQALSGGGRSDPDDRKGSSSTFGGSLKPSGPPNRRNEVGPSASPVSGSAAPSTMPPARTLALGMLVGGGGAVVAGVGILAVLIVVGWVAWAWLLPGPPPVAVVEPPAPVIAAAPVVTDPMLTENTETPPVPRPSAPSPSGREPAPAPAAVEDPAPTESPKPVAPSPSPAASAAPAAPVPSGSLPAELDPATSKPGRREELLLQSYRHKPAATGIIVTVMKTDPIADVRNIAGSVLRGRWKDGIDAAGSQAGAAWCAKSGDPASLRALCLRSLGELGDGRASAALVAGARDATGEAREAATDGCQRWAERYPSQAGEVAACSGAAPAKSLKEQVEDQIGKIKGD